MFPKDESVMCSVASILHLSREADTDGRELSSLVNSLPQNSRLQPPVNTSFTRNCCVQALSPSLVLRLV